MPKTKHRAGLPTDVRNESRPPPLLKQIELDPPRSYGSPVVALKDSIDNQHNHDTIAAHHRLGSPSQSFDQSNDRKQSHDQSSPVATRHRHSSDKQGSPIGSRERSSPRGTKDRRTNGHANREELNSEFVHPTLGRKGSDPVVSV